MDTRHSRHLTGDPVEKGAVREPRFEFTLFVEVGSGVLVAVLAQLQMSEWDAGVDASRPLRVDGRVELPDFLRHASYTSNV